MWNADKADTKKCFAMRGAFPNESRVSCDISVSMARICARREQGPYAVGLLRFCPVNPLAILVKALFESSSGAGTTITSELPLDTMTT